MASSHTVYGALGFWARDATVEDFLQLLAAVARSRPEPPPWLCTARKDWDLQATGGFLGCVDAGLDRHLAGDPDREALVLGLLDEVRDRIHAGGEAPPSDHRADPTKSHTVVLLEFTTAIAGLLRGDVTWDTTGPAPGVWA